MVKKKYTAEYNGHVITRNSTRNYTHAVISAWTRNGNTSIFSALFFESALKAYHKANSLGAHLVEVKGEDLCV